MITITRLCSIAKRNKLLGFSIVDKRIIKMFDIFIEQKQTNSHVKTKEKFPK